MQHPLTHLTALIVAHFTLLRFIPQLRTARSVASTLGVFVGEVGEVLAA